MFLSNPIELLDSLARSGPGIQRSHIGHKAFIFVFNAQAAREILVTYADAFGKNDTILKKITPITGEHGLVQLEGKASQEVRKKSRAIFSQDNLAHLQAVIEEIALSYVSSIPNDRAIAIDELMTELILNTAFRIFLGVNYKDSSKKVGQEFLRLNHICGNRINQLISLPLWLPSRQNKEIIALKNSIRGFILSTLKQETSKQEKNIVNLFSKSPHIIDQCMTFLFAGHETTASSLAFTFLLLTRYAHYQDRIANDFIFTKAIYQESLRLYPPAYMVTKKAKKNTSIQGLNIYKGDQIIIAIKQIHNSHTYFKDPHIFDPNRFIDCHHNPAFMPFSLGNKSCVGERLAYLEACIILQIFCKNFYIEPVGHSIETEQLITLHPKSGQKIKFSKR
ncbi:MAG: cytochrome P450 [Myxococcales bacterium]|nr:MAG: cytochrome P450 [Myxococcales bacterium]